MTYRGEYSKDTLMTSSGVNIRRSQPQMSPRFSLEDGKQLAKGEEIKEGY